jgi:hypothetical protein
MTQEHNEIILSPFFKFRMQIYGPDGQLRSDDETRNTVVTAGKNFLNDTVFRGTSYTNSIYMGLKGTGSVAAGDTMASHAGWAETSVYSGTARSLLSIAASVGGTSTVTPGTFAMTGTYTAAGAFIVSTGTAAGGTTGTLYSAGDFGVTRTGGTGDTLIVTPTLITA